jgi:hypothetical protein
MNIRILASLFTVLAVTSCVWDELPVDEVKVDCATVSLLLEVSKHTNASACGASDGEIELKVTGGEPPYTFAIKGASEQTSPTFKNLSSGFYSFVVSDKNNCSAESERVLIIVDQFSADFTTFPNTECLNFNGIIEIHVNETNGPYKFQVDSGDFKTDTRFENLKDGMHYITIEDADGCSFITPIPVDRSKTDVSWENDILPIMTASCAVTGCHNGVHLPRDWRVYSQVKTFASTIRKRTQDRSMPAEGILTDDQIALISCWIDDGAPEN